MNWSLKHIYKSSEIRKKTTNQTYVEFAREKGALFDKWVPLVKCLIVRH